MATTVGGAPVGDHTARCLLMFPATLACTCVDEVNRKIAELAVAFIGEVDEVYRLIDDDPRLFTIAVRARLDARRRLRAAVHQLNEAKP